jgi:hypothetical protein
VLVVVGALLVVGGVLDDEGGAVVVTVRVLGGALEGAELDERVRGAVVVGVGTFVTVGDVDDPARDRAGPLVDGAAVTPP